MPQPRKYPNAAARVAAYRERQRRAREAELEPQNLPPKASIATMGDRPRWHALMEAARATIETAQRELETYWHDRSETWQESERGEAMHEDIDDLERLADELAEIAAKYHHSR